MLWTSLKAGQELDYNCDFVNIQHGPSEKVVGKNLDILLPLSLSGASLYREAGDGSVEKENKGEWSLSPGEVSFSPDEWNSTVSTLIRVPKPLKW